MSIAAYRAVWLGVVTYYGWKADSGFYERV